MSVPPRSEIKHGRGRDYEENMREKQQWSCFDLKSNDPGVRFGILKEIFVTERA